MVRKSIILDGLFTFAFPGPEVLSNFAARDVAHGESALIHRMDRMKLKDWLKSEVEYGRDLADSGLAGAREALDGQPLSEIFTNSARASWAPTAIGAAAGAVCSLLVQGRRPKAATVAALTLVGGVVGFTAGVAWQTRELSGGIARGAIRNTGPIRDSHWLDRHPINFG
jgi:hypothetical protein